MATPENNDPDDAQPNSWSEEFKKFSSELREPRDLAGRALTIGVTIAGIMSAGVVFADSRILDYGRLVWAGGLLMYIGVTCLGAGTATLWGTAVPQVDRSLRRRKDAGGRNPLPIQRFRNWYQIAIFGLYLEILGALLLGTGVAVADRPEPAVIVERIICCS